jgi:hypothetical protein
VRRKYVTQVLHTPSFSLPSHFNYSRVRSKRRVVLKYYITSQRLPDRYPYGVYNNRVGFDQRLFYSDENDNKQHHTNHHPSHIYRRAKYFIHSPYEMFSSDSASHQTIYAHQMIVYLNPQKTIIDETLESYPLERLSYHFCSAKRFQFMLFLDVDATFMTKNH